MKPMNPNNKGKEKIEKCSYCGHSKDNHKFGYEEHCLEMRCKCERYEN